MIGTLIGGWYLYHLIEYGFHSLGHYIHPYNYINKLHKQHHLDYPPHNLKSKTYRGNREGVKAYSLPIVIVSLSLYSFLSWDTFKIISIELSFLMILNDYLHTHIHLDHSWLDKYEWFRRSRRLHFIHHKRSQYNLSFGGLSHRIDKMIGSFKD